MAEVHDKRQEALRHSEQPRNTKDRKLYQRLKMVAGGRFELPTLGL